FRDVSRFDIIHFHCDYVHFPLLRLHRCATITTLHGRLHVPDLAPLFAEYSEVPVVAISEDQRKTLPDANWLATVYHGLPRELYRFKDRPDEYLAFLGRMSPDKGVEEAIEISRRAGMRLKIAGKVYAEEKPYFQDVLTPLFEESASFVEFIGEVGGKDKEDFLGNARALLFPIKWQEPFGLVMIESMACGTPVIAYRDGSVPEVLEDGVTGFVVDDQQSAAEAVKRIADVSRRDCRLAFEERFDASRMARDYVEVYRRLACDGVDFRRPAARVAEISRSSGFEQNGLGSRASAG